MNEHEHHDLRMSLGAYVLGQLPAAETTALEAHLDTCPDCSAELAELTPVANALGQLRGQRQPDETLVPPADLGDRVVEAVTSTARRESRQTWLRAASLTAAAAVVAVIATVAVQSLNAATRSRAYLLKRSRSRPRDRSWRPRPIWSTTPGVWR